MIEITDRIESWNQPGEDVYNLLRRMYDLDSEGRFEMVYSAARRYAFSFTFTVTWEPREVKAEISVATDHPPIKDLLYEMGMEGPKKRGRRLNEIQRFKMTLRDPNNILAAAKMLGDAIAAGMGAWSYFEYRSRGMLPLRE